LRENPRGSLVRALGRSLRAAADPSKAPGMQAYMKSSMPYLGVQTPYLRRAIRPLFRLHVIDNSDDWRDTVLELWRTASYREEWYTAVELAGFSPYAQFRALPALPMYEEMIVAGAWWDVVDAIATRQLGDLLRKDPAEMAAVLRRWAASDNLWMRRSAILAQLKFKKQTDLELLYDCIQPSIGSPEFFLRKGVGWALREFSKTDSREVRRYVKLHEAELSSLTMREATKYCGPHSSKSR
jgi:3-methyladenine DNA glycosylase AlkD